MAAPREELDGRVAPAALGKYLLLEQVARGRMGTVHRAALKDAGESSAPLALLRFTPELSADSEFVDAFARVMARAAQVEHPAHCAIVDADRAPDGTLFAAREWVDGKDLKRVARALRDRGTTMPAPLVAFIGAQVAEALAAAHGLRVGGKRAELLHGELSPVDILIGFDGRVRLAGLGSAELTVAAELPPARMAYQAPEIELGAPCSPRSDVFSLGACLYQLFSFRPADSGADSDERRRADSHITQIVPPALKQILSKALAPQPEARMASALELARALQAWSAEQTQPGSAEALAALMGELFEEARPAPEPKPAAPALAAPAKAEPAPTRDAEGGGDPWNGPEERTPAKGVLMTALAAQMVDGESRPTPVQPAPDDSAAAIVAAVVNEPWEDESWDDETPRDHPWLAALAAPSLAEVRARAAAAAAAPSAARPQAPLPRRPERHPPVPARTAVPAAPAIARAPAQPIAAPAPVLAGWQEPRTRPPWRAIAAGSALVIGIAGIFALGGDEDDAAKDRAAQATVQAANDTAARAANTGEEPREEPAPAAVEDLAQAVSATGRAEQAAPSSFPEAASKQDTARGARSERTREPDEPATRLHAESERELGQARDQRTAALQPERSRQPAVLDQPESEPAAPMASPTPAPAARSATPAAVPELQPNPYSGSGPITAPQPAAAPKPAPAADTRAAAQPAATGPTRAPILIDQVAPRFPSRAHRLGITHGMVSIVFTIDEQGRVKDAVVDKSDPPRVFDEAALDAIREWRYEPKLVNGKAVATRQRFTFRFQ